MRILVADDAPAGRALIRRLLELEGHSVRTALDGTEAVDEARRWQPDLVLMDLHMPICDGVEATRRLHDNPETSELPVVALTASADETEVRSAFEAGCVGYLAKPIEVAHLVTQLEAWLRARHIAVAV
jgi:two-component system, cell cycle response regulator DivK